MKKLYTYAISIATVFVLLCSHGLFAQPTATVISNGQIEDCTEIIPNKGVTENTVNTIVEEDYPYLKNLSCLKNNYFADR